MDNIVDRMHQLCAQGQSDDAAALYEEIRDWMVEGVGIEIMSLDYIEDQLENC
jgi:hypothetical protein